MVARKNSGLKCAEYQGRGAKIASDASQDYGNEEYDISEDNNAAQDPLKNGLGKV